MSGGLLASIGIKNFKVAGDTRFDRVLMNRLEAKPNQRIEAFLNGQKAIIIGSSWPEDEKVWINYMLANPQQKFVIAPHDVSQKRVESLQRSLQEASNLYTCENDPRKHILILNTIGHLSSTYQYAKLAYVGGGFSGKLHNILEPAVFGIPVLFGPKHDRFPEAEAFIQNNFGFSVKDKNSLSEVLGALLQETNSTGSLATDYVEHQKGASQKLVSHLFTNFY